MYSFLNCVQSDNKLMINTLNESKLHKTLKIFYAQKNEGCSIESPVGSYIADILTAQGNIIEIQTASLAHLAPKIRSFLEEKRKITVVHPLVVTKYIETIDSDTGCKKSRKSPQHKSIYSLFRELTALTPYLLHKDFALDVLEVSIAEERHSTNVPVQSENKLRRIKKNWLKDDKRLLSIESTKSFCGPAAYLALLPRSLSSTFTAKELCDALLAEGKKIKRSEANLMLWLYLRLGLIKRGKNKGRAYTYSIS